MLLSELNIENFMGIESGKVKFGTVGLVLIEGINNDSPSSASNGAGKSTIYEALHWALFGKTKRGITGDAVINRFVGKNCLVSLYFMVKGTKYSLIRTRKHDTHGTHLQFNEGENPLTKGTVKETQELIESIIGMDAATFDKVVHFGQGDVKPFADLRDAELKRIFEQALGMQYFTEQAVKIKAYKNTIKSELNQKETEKTMYGRELANIDEQIAYLNKASKDLEVKKQAALDSLRKEIEIEYESLENAKRLIVTTNAEIEAKRELVSEQTEKIAKLTALKDTLVKAHYEQTTKLSLQVTACEKARRELLKYAQDSKTANQKVGTPCGECGRKFTPQEVAPFLKQVGEAIQAKRVELQEAENKLVEIKAKVTEIQKLSDTLDSEVLKYKDVQDAIVGLKVKEQNLIQLDTNIKTLTARIGKMDAQLEALKKDDSGYMEEIEKAVTKNKALVDEMGKVEKDIADLYELSGTIDLLDDILGNGGLKSFVFDNITPELNKMINRFINVLDDIQIEISTVSKLKSGDYREKFGIEVKNPNGAEEYIGNSGGEKQKINLAIALGFNDMLRAMSSEPINVLFLDEPFESLDEASSERVIDVCKMLANNSNVFVITHQSGIKDLIAESIMVVKNNGKSSIQ